MRSSSWGLWRDKVNAEDILAVPIRLPDTPGNNEQRIVELVDCLTRDSVGDDLLGGIFSSESNRNDDYSVLQLLQQIDEGIYELFELSQAEQDLIDDFHRYTVDISANWQKARGLRPVSIPRLRAGTEREDVERVNVISIRNYLDRFLSEWNKVLPPEGEFSWEMVAAPGTEMLGVVFETRQRRDDAPTPTAREWTSLLVRLEESLYVPESASFNADMILRSVSDTSIVIIKQPQERMWSATTGREDAEATMLQAMRLQEV